MHTGLEVRHRGTSLVVFLPHVGRHKPIRALSAWDGLRVQTFWHPAQNIPIQEDPEF